MAVRDVLLLGNPKLYEVSGSVRREELGSVASMARDLHDTLMDFRERYGAGRAIAAPQVAVMKRVIYLCLDRPTVLINPTLSDRSRETIVVWDDCMCFPDLLVRVRRHRSCWIHFRDLEWTERHTFLTDDLSELLQHEYDHLDGILTVSRAMDGRAFAFRSQRTFLD